MTGWHQVLVGRTARACLPDLGTFRDAADETLDPHRREWLASFSEGFAALRTFPPHNGETPSDYFTCLLPLIVSAPRGLASEFLEDWEAGKRRFLQRLKEAAQGA
jgi:hypothetical protein